MATAYTAIPTTAPPTDPAASAEPTRRYTRTHLLLAIVATFLMTAVLLPHFPKAIQSRSPHTRPALSHKNRQVSEFFSSLEEVHKGDDRLKAPKVIVLAYESGQDEMEEASDLAAKLEQVMDEISAAGIHVYRMNATGGKDAFYLEVITGWNDLYLPGLVFITEGHRGNLVPPPRIGGRLDWKNLF